VDELDKVVDFEDIRTFLRRIKAVFEVPGVYYFISLAEDTLTALYLGSAEGKNEIDSSFDHIIRVPPVSCDVGQIVASSYLTTHNIPELPARLTRTIATLSFGVPRDIIRRCDEFIAQRHSTLTPDQLFFDTRKSQAQMGYELRKISRVQMVELSGEPRVSADNAQRILKDCLENESAQRLVLSLWLISLVQAALALQSELQWERVTNEICAIGYRLTIDQVIDIENEVKRIHDSLFP
jgi:hypothetical protein